MWKFKYENSLSYFLPTVGDALNCWFLVSSEAKNLIIKQGGILHSPFYTLRALRLSQVFWSNGIQLNFSDILIMQK